MEANSVCNHTCDNEIGRPHSESSICLSRASLIRQTEFKRHEVLLPINNKNLNSRENKKFSNLKKAPIKESAHCFYDD